jgi:hypothetical protein
MAGLIDVGILKPELAGSFAAGYRGAEEQRNALAQRQQQAAQAEQQIASGRQRLQMDEMTMQRMQEDRAALTGLRARLRAAGQSDDPKVFFRVLAESDDPNVMMKGIEGLQRYRALEAYDREFGPRAMAAPAMPSSAPGAMAAPAELAAGAQPEPMAPVPGVISTSRVPGVTTAPISMPAAAGEGVRGIVPAVNTLAPPAAAPVNAMLAAQPAATAPNIDALRRQYSMAVAAGRSDAPVLLKQIEAALRGDQNRPFVVGNRLVSPTGQELYVGQQGTASLPVSIAEFERAKTDPAFMQFLQDRAAAIRPPAAPRPEPAPRTQQVTMSDGTLGIVNMDTGVITPSTVDGVPVKGKANKDLAVSEQQASYNLGRILDAAKEINAALKKDPNALKPGIGEASAASVGLSGTANVARSAQRQIVYGAQRDALDAMLYLATGAAYNKEQLEGQMAAYVPAFTDKPDAVEAKRVRMLGLIQSAKVRAGKAWTPEMDAASQALLLPVASSAKPAGGNKPPAAPGASNLTQDQEALNWANSNPNDPRAAQIKQRLGAK